MPSGMLLLLHNRVVKIQLSHFSYFINIAFDIRHTIFLII